MRRLRLGALVSGLLVPAALVVIVLPLRMSFAGSRGQVRMLVRSPLPAAPATASSNVCSQWRILASPNIGHVFNFLTGAAAIASNDVWAVGSGGTSAGLILHWNGAQWNLSPTPLASGQMNLLGITALSSDDVWAVGSVVSGPNDTLTTLTLHWNGSAWSIIPSPNVSGVNSGLNAVVAIAPKDVWAVGNTVNATNVESTLAMHWDGSSWTIVSTPDTGGVSNVFNGIAAIDTEDIWAVGSVNGSTLTDHWNGSAWSVVSSPNGSPNGSQLLAVTALASNDVWAVGGSNGSFPNGPADSLVEHWTGSAWNVIVSPNVYNDNILNSVAAIPGTNQLWAVGATRSNGGSSGHSLIEEWNGSLWTVSIGADAPASYAELFAVTATSGTIWAVGSNNASLNLTLIEAKSRLQLGIHCP